MSHIIHYVTTNFKKIFHTVCTEIISCIQGTALHFVLVAAFLGTLNHFLYFLSGQSPIVALFCPVNESVWEHLKLLYFPFLFVSIWEYLSLHPVVLPILDILLFYSSVIFSFGMSEYISGKTRSPHETEPGFVVSLWLITSFFFFVFTCFPPDLPLFYSA